MGWASLWPIFSQKQSGRPGLRAISKNNFVVDWLQAAILGEKVSSPKLFRY
jgi:hypothetical protein